MSMPNFVVIGAAKSGTSSLYYYLQQHPDIGMCQIKEPNFFTFEGCPSDFVRATYDFVDINDLHVSTLEKYQHLFSHITTEKAVGDVSPMYMFRAKHTAGFIQHYNADTMLIQC
ncbi:MAG: hypothetical protein Q9M28_08095 [Mariprofundaceae bacterium]|nr:hypothetical protein [Mariprofundaceae bacterium]